MIPSVSSASPTKIMEKEKEKSDNSEMFQGNAEKKPAWNSLSNGDSGKKPVMVASSSWPSLSEVAKAAVCSTMSSSDGSSSSVYFFSQQSSTLAELERMQQTLTDAFNKINERTVSQASGCPLPDASPSNHNKWNVFASQSPVSTHNQHQQNSYKNQNVSYYNPHQSYGGRHNQEHVNLPRNFHGLGGFSQPPRGGTPAFVKPSPPPHVASSYAHYVPAQPYFYPIAFTDFPPPMMHHPHRVPFMEPPPVLFPSQNHDRMPSIEPPPVLVPSQQKAPLETKTLSQVQKAPLKTKTPNQVQKVPLKTKILNQVQYYLSDDNLANDVYLRKRMNDDGFVHVELIAGFSKLKALTSNIQLILDSLQGSDIVEVKDYEIRNRSVWRKYVMPRDWRVAFYPSPEYAVPNNHQNMQLEQQPEEVGSSSSNQNDDNNNN